MIDHAKRQQQIFEKEYLHLVAENVTHEAWHSGGKQRKWPVGARYFYALQKVYVARHEREVAE
jgi:hypothetical protein